MATNIEDRESYVGQIVMRVANTRDMEVVDAAVGDILTATAEAFASGVAAGKSRAMRMMSDEPGLSLAVENPYLRSHDV